jgi:hypothetical protein
MKNFSLFIALLILASCGTQTRLPLLDPDAVKAEADKQKRQSQAKAEIRWEQDISKWIDDSHRLAGVSSKILTKGAKYCEERKHIGPYLGMRAWSKYYFVKEWQPAAVSRLGLGKEVQLYLVDPASPADSAGLKTGDVILALNDQPLPSGKKAIKKFEEKLAELAKIGVPLEITIRRDEEQQKISVTPSMACKSKVLLAHDGPINAYADGENIVIFKKMMDFFETDEEMALIVSHELAHNSMQHSTAKQINGWALWTVGAVGGVTIDVLLGTGSTTFADSLSKLGWAIGTGAGSVEFEREADYVGLYFMALGGYDIGNAPNFWRRMAEVDPKIITMSSSHPTSPERYVAMANAVQEIQEKAQAGLPQKPEPAKPHRRDFGM